MMGDGDEGHFEGRGQPDRGSTPRPRLAPLTSLLFPPTILYKSRVVPVAYIRPHVSSMIHLIIFNNNN